MVELIITATEYIPMIHPIIGRDTPFDWASIGKKGAIIAYTEFAINVIIINKKSKSIG